MLVLLHKRDILSAFIKDIQCTSIRGYPRQSPPLIRSRLLGYNAFILLPAGTCIVLPVGYMNQPIGLLHIYL